MMDPINLSAILEQAERATEDIARLMSAYYVALRKERMPDELTHILVKGFQDMYLLAAFKWGQEG